MLRRFSWTIIIEKLKIYSIRTVVGVKARISREKTNEYYFCVSKKWFGPGTIYCQEDLIIIIIIILKGGYD